MSASPNFFVTSRVIGVNSGASANVLKTLAGTTNTVAVIAGVAAGSIISRVLVVQNSAAASTANNICRFFILYGTSYFLIHEVNLGGAVTPSTTVIGFRITVPELVGVKLPSDTHVLHVGFSAAAAADSCTVTAEVVDS